MILLNNGKWKRQEVRDTGAVTPHLHWTAPQHQQLRHCFHVHFPTPELFKYVPTTDRRNVWCHAEERSWKLHPSSSQFSSTTADKYWLVSISPDISRSRCWTCEWNATKPVVQCLGAPESLATPSGDERVCKASDAGETTDEGTTSGDVNFDAADAVSGEENLPVLALCTGLRTLSALRNTVISYTPAVISTNMTCFLPGCS